MDRTGNYFDVELKKAHLNWGTEGASRTSKQRNPFEMYLPISIDNARIYNIKAGEVFNGSSSDGFFEGALKATGSQGNLNQYGKNLHKEGDLRALGYWLKDRVNAQVGDKVRVKFIDEHTIKLSLLKA